MFLLIVTKNNGLNNRATAFKTTIDKIILKQIASRFVPRGRNDGIIKLLDRLTIDFNSF